ncbi:MAG TPA: VOC family protein [Gemmatimonadales bacterium]|jgi:catechol 2,3-dioxygenase|nr:VOC family protein [Gemmatimonadales bacterium]
MDASAVAAKTSAASRLPADARIGRVRLRVGDLGRALELYRDVLGLEVARDEGARVTLAPRGSAGKRELIVLEEQPGITRRPARPVSTGLYHVALLVPGRRDLGRSLLRLHESGYPLRGMSDHAVSESLYLDDPYGNGLEIYADRPRTLWPIQNGVVQMTVDPMDVEAVVAAGRERPEPWNGLAADTVVGHVHFTVSRMDRAVAFYRDVIGFDVMMKIPSLTAVSAGGYHHHLNLNTWAGEGAPPDSDRVAGLLGWELVVPDAQARRALIDRLGAARALTGGTTATDPDRIPIELEAVP